MSKKKKIQNKKTPVILQQEISAVNYVQITKPAGTIILSSPYHTMNELMGFSVALKNEYFKDKKGEKFPLGVY